MKSIKLTQGQFALVDDEDFDWLNQWKWCARLDGGTNSYYAIRAQPYIGNNGRRKQKTVYMAREVMNTPPDLICDHINHDTLDNRRGNLRNVSKTQNNQNPKGARKDNRGTGVLGVRHHGCGFIANIYIDGKRVWSPTYLEIGQAISWRKGMELRHYVPKVPDVYDNL